MIEMMYCGKQLQTAPLRWVRVCSEDQGACPSCLRAHIAKQDAALSAAQAELTDIRESTTWLASVDPDEIRDEELHHAALIDFRRWARISRHPGAVGNLVYSFEDFLIPHARAQGEKKVQAELATATTEIAERDDTIDTLRNDIASLRMQLAYATAERDALKAELGPTNRQIHEDAAGMGLEDAFFRMNGIDPDERPGRKVERNAGRVAPVLTGEEGEAKAHALGWDPSLIETYHEVGMLDGLGGDAPRPTDPVAWQAGIEIGRTLRKALAG